MKARKTSGIYFQLKNKQHEITSVDTEHQYNHRGINYLLDNIKFDFSLNVIKIVVVKIKNKVEDVTK